MSLDLDMDPADAFGLHPLLIQRLRAAVPALVFVGDDLDLDSQMSLLDQGESPTDLPAAYVEPVGYTLAGAPGNRPGPRTVASLWIVWVLARSAPASSALADFGRLITAVQDALIGWHPPGLIDPLAYPDNMGLNLDRRPAASLATLTLIAYQFR